MRTYYRRKQVDELQWMLIEEEKETHVFSTLNTLLLKLAIANLSEEKDLSQKEVRELADYLFGVDYWGRYEVGLLGDTGEVLPIDTFYLLTKEMFRRTDFYNGGETNRLMMVQVALNCLLECTDQGRWVEARFILSELKKMGIDETAVYERTVLLYAEGYLTYSQGKVKGKEQMEQAIVIFRLAGSEHLGENFQEHYQSVLKKHIGEK